MLAADLVALSLTLPIVGADNNVWGQENNACLSSLQTLSNEFIGILQDHETQIAQLTIAVEGITGGANLSLLTSDLLGVPNGIATLDATGAVDPSQVVFR